MSETDDQARNDAHPPHKRFGIWLLLSLAMIAGLAGLAGLALTGRMVAMPLWVTERVEARLNAAVAPVELRLGGMDVMLSRDNVPRVHFSDILVLDGAGREIARLPELGATLAAAPLLSGRLEISHLALTGADLTLRRAPDGRLDLALGGTGAPVSAAGSLGEVLDEIDRAFARPGLSAVRAISVEDLGLTYEDARAGRTWAVENGLMTLDQGAEEVTLRAFFSLRGAGATPAEFAFSFVSVRGGPEARFSANFSDVSSDDIATQSPALAPLALIEAPISGAIRTEVDAAGTLGPLSAALEIGAGALNPAGAATPIRFQSGKSYFTYDPASRRLSFDQIALDTAALRMVAEGHADLRDMEGGWPETVIAQLGFREVALDPEGVFEAPAVFTGGALDLKLALDPFVATAGQVALLDDAGAYRGRGVIRARPDGWEISVDADIPRIDEDRLLALWPLGLAPRTRAWIDERVQTGAFLDVRAAVRRTPGAPAEIALGHRFRDATVKVLSTMPPIEGGHGYGTILDQGYTLSVEGGTIRAPLGGRIDVTGSVFQVPDIAPDDPPATIRLRTRSSISAALSLIDLPPLEIPARVGLDPDLAEGEAVLETRLDLPLRKGLSLADIGYGVRGTLTGVRSDALLEGRLLAADTLDLAAGPDGVTISGAARVDGVPVRGAWRMQPGAPGSRVEGTAELSQRLNADLGLGLPPGTFEGRARAEFTLTLPDEGPPRFTVGSDLSGLALRLPGLDWSKPAAASGRLRIAGRLGASAAVERLELEAPGLSVAGSVALNGQGGLDAARLSRVRLGGWLDAQAVLTGRGAGRPPAVAITGGRADLRQGAFARSGGGGGGAGFDRVEIALDRLQVSDGIALTGLRGALSGRGGLSGRLTGTLEGGGPIVATLVPARTGTAIRVRAEDAGAALRGAGLYRRARGGRLDLVLRPLGAPGRYAGELRVDGLRVRGTPVLAELLTAISVVGIPELLDGEGLMFSEVQARFELMPGGVEVRRASAVGPSLGISLSGVYGTRTNRIDMQGVISPIYLVNSIGSVLTRQGEGLFGFNYRLVGDARDPEVRVNPLSIFTPGMFREIFRGPPPRVQRRPQAEGAE
ncbi:AsmA-like C-terminal region [Rhodovulum sp. ES.010]|uniref:hypothetical protein n=1 Tax=Rhodovulum sp. ES.010 TaxID=1882821 RepID=UPI000928CD06|nr:hypothetical protein [Rhodovulum sp. ES.010]SIO08152.1 AsmA-like C-terminal region [Rhodovulum sp. ES.010]